MTAPAPSTALVARRVSIAGVVQGVGFRPFVYRMAMRHRVAGWVTNDVAGVLIHAEAPPAELAAFINDLSTLAPPAARVARVAVRNARPEGRRDFRIRASDRGWRPTVRISPDLATCDECLAELRDPQDGRFGYPYINCTNCGPRYSIVRSLPYDRSATTMQSWPLCPHCQGQYDDPIDRRYHAQPVACRHCGPSYELIEPERRWDGFGAAISRTVELLRAGGVVAIKGVGGYHLACDACNASAVNALRTRKFRKEKPFALLVRDLAEADELAELSDEHRRLLADVARPIVLARAKVDLPCVAPDSDTLGIMLPSMPLHYLLFDAGAPSPLVLTSANRSSEPIAYLDDDARQRLAGLADALLVGERPIARRIDDSVVAVRSGGPFMIRRARGFAPSSVCRLPTRDPILALGSDLKNAIALVVDGEVFVSQHIGDLGDLETDRALEETVHDLSSMYDVDASRLTVVHDLHPQFTSTRLAASLPSLRTVAVQHHHAHIASVLAEHELFDERAVGVALDGTGYGLDGGIWGGEFFVGSLREGFARAAWLREVLMPGGDAAAGWPPQAAAAFLAQLDGLPDMTAAPFCFPRRYVHARSMVERRLRCFASTSMGRLFDAVAALLGFTRAISFEGQAAMWLENQARRAAPQSAYEFPDWDPRPLLRSIVQDRLAGRSISEIAAAFHATVAAGVVDQIGRLCQRHQLATAALSGGVFQNELLWDLIHQRVAQLGQPIRLLSNRLVGVNDGGIALGQAALASVGSAALVQSVEVPRGDSP